MNYISYLNNQSNNNQAKMPIFTKTFLLRYLFALATLCKMYSLIKPIQTWKRLSADVFEPVEYIESWDDGEIPWDLEGSSNVVMEKRHVVLEPKKYKFGNGKMDDGEVEWELDIKMSLTAKTKNSLVDSEKTDKMVIWDFIDDVKRNENINFCVKKMAEQLITTENIFTDVMNIQTSRSEFDMLLTAAVLLVDMKKTNETKVKKTSESLFPLNNLFTVFAFMLTKGVEPVT